MCVLPTWPRQGSARRSPKNRTTPASSGSPMVRTKAQVRAVRSLSQQAAAAERGARRRASILKAARIPSAKELAAQRAAEEDARARASETEEEVACTNESEEDTLDTPEPAHVIKLGAEACGSGGRCRWRGRLRGGGADVILAGTWVRQNFKAYAATARTLAHASCLLSPVLVSRLARSFLASVQAAGGRFVHIPTGSARPQQQAAPAGLGGQRDGPSVLSAPGTSASAEVILTAECPVVAYRRAPPTCAPRTGSRARCTSTATARAPLPSPPAPAPPSRAATPSAT